MLDIAKWFVFVFLHSRFCYQFHPSLSHIICMSLSRRRRRTSKTSTTWRLHRRYPSLRGSLAVAVAALPVAVESLLLLFDGAMTTTVAMTKTPMMIGYCSHLPVA